MKKLVLSISMFLIAATTFAQSEVVTDSFRPFHWMVTRILTDLCWIWVP